MKVCEVCKKIILSQKDMQWTTLPINGVNKPFYFHHGACTTAFAKYMSVVLKQEGLKKIQGVAQG